MSHSLFSLVAHMALISVTVVLSLSPIMFFAYLSGQVSGLGGVL